MPNKTGVRGRSIIKKWEGLGPKFNKTGRIIAYLCPAKKPTIGYGHTKGLTMMDVNVREISMEQAESYLDTDLRDAERYVNSLNPDLNANQFDALVSAAFNLGSFGTGLTNLIKSGKFKEVPKKLQAYIHASPGSEPCKGRCGNKNCKARIEPGLITRRVEEAKLFGG